MGPAAKHERFLDFDRPKVGFHMWKASTGETRTAAGSFNKYYFKVRIDVEKKAGIAEIDYTYYENRDNLAFVIKKTFA